VSGCCFQSTCAPAELCAAADPGVGGGQLAGTLLLESHIDGEFEGWETGRIYKLENGQYWQQVSGEYAYDYSYRPVVRIVADGAGYRMFVDGIDRSIAVERVDVVTESQIVSDFDGWDGETIFELANGQVWQQAGAGIAVHVAVRPDAMIYRKNGSFEMRVEGVSSTVPVRRLQ